MMSAGSRPRINLRRLQDHAVKLCQETLLKDGQTTCLFRGLFQQAENNDEFAVALGEYGRVVLCDVIKHGSFARNSLQKRTTLIHLLCQRKLQLLVFLLKRHKKKAKRLRGEDHEGIVKAIHNRHFGVVADFLLSLAQNVEVTTDDDNQTPLEWFILTLNETDACLQSWLAVFKKLVILGQDNDISGNNDFLRCVLQQLAQIKYRQRRCIQSECVCETDLIKNLWYINSEFVEASILIEAVRHRNLNLVRMLLDIDSMNLNLNITESVDNRGEESGGSGGETVLLYLIKSGFGREKHEEAKLLQTVKELSERIDINAVDNDGMGVLFYAALFKLRKIFYFLLDHPKFNPLVLNDQGETLVDLFVWADINHTNPAALVALRRLISRKREAPQLLPRTSSDQTCALAPETRSRKPSEKQQIDEVDSPESGTLKRFHDAITDNFPQFCQDMEPEGKLLDVLIQKHVLAWNKIDSIRSEKSRHDKARRVLTLVLRSGTKGHAAFIEALKKSSQEHLAYLVEPKSPGQYSNSDAVWEFPKNPSQISNDMNSDTSTEEPSSSVHDQDSFNWSAGQFEDYRDRKHMQTSQVIPSAIFLPANDEINYGSLGRDETGLESLSRSTGIEDLTGDESPRYVPPVSLDIPDRIAPPGHVRSPHMMRSPYVVGQVEEVRIHDVVSTTFDNVDSSRDIRPSAAAGLFQHADTPPEIEQSHDMGYSNEKVLPYDEIRPPDKMGSPDDIGQLDRKDLPYNGVEALNDTGPPDQMAPSDDIGQFDKTDLPYDDIEPPNPMTPSDDMRKFDKTDLPYDDIEPSNGKGPYHQKRPSDGMGQFDKTDLPYDDIQPPSGMGSHAGIGKNGNRDLSSNEMDSPYGAEQAHEMDHSPDWTIPETVVSV